MSLSDAQLDRYARHIVLPEIGGGGQRKLLSSHIVVIGAGGIGSPAIQYLAAAGIGRLTIIDDDQVALSNLQRQTLFGSGDMGKPKAELAAQAVGRLNPDVEVRGLTIRVDAANAAGLLRAADAILDGSDNFETRLIVADAALAARVPLVSAAVSQFEGQLAVYRGWEPDRPCYRCLVGSDPEQPETSCADQGVLGAMAGVMGSLAAMEAIRAITGFGEGMAGKLLRIDALSLRFRASTLRKDPGCLSCKG